MALQNLPQRLETMITWYVHTFWTFSIMTSLILTAGCNSALRVKCDNFGTNPLLRWTWIAYGHILLLIYLATTLNESIVNAHHMDVSYNFLHQL